MANGSDWSLWAAIAAGAAAVAGLLIGGAREKAKLQERVATLEAKSADNVTRDAFAAHEDLYTESLKVLGDIRADVRTNTGNLAEMKADVRANATKLDAIEKRLDRDFERQVRGG